jgi:HAD superfamily hydrolase (TIGR01509 family)
MRFDTILWDFDGTLFDTYPPLVAAIAHALADAGFSAPPDEIATLLSDTLEVTITTLADRHGLDAAAFEAAIRRHWSTTTPRENPPFPGALELCRRFRAAGGRNFIVTHRDRETLMALLNWYDAAGLFEDCLARDDGYPRKPDPASYHALVEKHDLDPDTMLVVGDRALDILAGQNAGMHTCLYDSGPTPDATPDYVIARFEELDAILAIT